MKKLMGINLTEVRHGNLPEVMQMTSDLIIPDERVLNALHKSRLTENLLDFEINVLVSLITVHYFEAKEIIADLDEESTKDALMILVEGKIEVSAMVGNEPVLLLLESPGDLARIMSFVGNDMMGISAKVKIWRDSAVLLLRRSRLESLLQSHPSIVYCVMRNLVRHVHSVARRKNAEKEELSNYFYSMHGRY